jgi:sugar phosphate isomerase/epimerase
MKLGIATSVFIQYPIHEAVTMIADAGYDGIDIWGGRPHVYRQDFSEKELVSLRKWIEDSGLEVSSFMPAFYHYPHSLSNPNPKVRRDSLDYMRVCLDNAMVLGAEILLMVPDNNLHGQKVEDSIHRLIEGIAAVSSYASGYNILLGLEVTELVQTGKEALKIIESIGDEKLGVVIDSGHINLGGEQFGEIVDDLGSRLLQVHVNDNDGEIQQNLIPGEGTFDFEGMFQKLRKIQYDGFVSLELAKMYGSGPGPAIRASAQRLRAWMV